MSQKLLDLASTVVQTGYKRILAKRQSDKDAATPLSALIATRTTDLFLAREFEQHVETMTLKVAKRLKQLCQNELSGLDEGEQSVAVEHAAAAFGRISVSDAELFDADLKPDRIAAKALAAEAPQLEGVDLSEAGQRFYELLTLYTAECLVQLITSLPHYQPRALTELLERSSQVEEKLDAALLRLPVPSLFAPQGDDLDEDFRREYLRTVGQTLDELELFGVDVRSFKARTALSVAYIGLSVRTHREARNLRDPREWLAASESPMEDRVVAVEEVLGRSSRMLLRGEAGSGKSTLLRWLAVNAARSGFRDDLADLNGMVPVLVKLRSWKGEQLPQPEDFLTGTAPELTAIMPSGFMHRALRSGRLLLLIDGVDELPSGQRPKVRRWLARLLKTFPDNRMVVTSRPSAAAENWLSDEDFAPAMLERMSPTDVRELVRHWHSAIRDAGNLPCPESELPGYERAILSKLDASADLRTMATTPLLCAMLCALNLDRRRHLPHNRVELYQAALAMLIDRRDAEREISTDGPRLGQSEKRVLLRDLACKLSVNHRSELPLHKAVKRVSKKLESMPHVDHEAADVFEYLLERSGVLRQPQLGRIDFVHRTFQEFLTADQAADDGDMGMLVGNAHLDQWQETVTLAAGLANGPDRAELISGLLARGAKEQRHARRLRILAACCLETTADLAPELAERIGREIDLLLPPRTKNEAATLARIGAPLLRHLPRDPSRLTEAAASSTVWAAALVNGVEAMSLLKGFAADTRDGVQSALIEVWKYFDPEGYAREVLAEVPFINGRIYIDNPELLPALRHLRHITSVHVSLLHDTDLSVLNDVSHLTSLTALCDIDDSTPLEQHLQLETARFYSDIAFDPTPLTRLPKLLDLSIMPTSDMDLGFLSACTALRVLSVDLGYLHVVPLVVWDLAKLTGVGFRNIPSTCDLNGLLRLRNLHRLSLSCLSAVPNLDALARCSSLRSLHLFGLESPPDLEPVAAIPRLETLLLSFKTEVPPTVDFEPFGDRQLTVFVDKEQGVLNVGPGIDMECMD